MEEKEEEISQMPMDSSESLFSLPNSRVDESVLSSQDMNAVPSYPSENTPSPTSTQSSDRLAMQGVSNLQTETSDSQRLKYCAEQFDKIKDGALDSDVQMDTHLAQKREDDDDADLNAILINTDKKQIGKFKGAALESAVVTVEQLAPTIKEEIVCEILPQCSKKVPWAEEIGDTKGAMPGLNGQTATPLAQIIKKENTDLDNLSQSPKEDPPRLEARQIACEVLESPFSQSPGIEPAASMAVLTESSGREEAVVNAMQVPIGTEFPDGDNGSQQLNKDSIDLSENNFLKQVAGCWSEFDRNKHVFLKGCKW